MQKVFMSLSAQDAALNTSDRNSLAESGRMSTAQGV
jgi:hypothetical protein